MRNTRRQSGLSLTEILVVLGIIAILMGVSIPAAKQLAASFETGTSVRQLINAALSNARAIAVREQAYAGVRFQEDINGNAYLIFIIQDEDATGLANGFRAVTGRNPMKLPEDIGVLSGVYNDDDLKDAAIFNDAKTFSIVFSPQGKLTTHLVRVRNYEGDTESDLPSFCPDTIFNIKPRDEAGLAMFYQDDYFLNNTSGYPNLGLGEEESKQNFCIYSHSDLKAIPVNLRWTNYFSNMEPEYVSPYTGELVLKYREEKP